MPLPAGLRKECTEKSTYLPYLPYLRQVAKALSYRAFGFCVYLP